MTIEPKQSPHRKLPPPFSGVGERAPWPLTDVSDVVSLELRRINFLYWSSRKYTPKGHENKKDRENPSDDRV
jgi:hypothetical protein